MIVRGNNAWRGDGRVESEVEIMNDDKIKGVDKFVNGNSNVLCEIDARKEVVELNSLWIEKVINIINCCEYLVNGNRPDIRYY